MRDTVETNIKVNNLRAPLRRHSGMRRAIARPSSAFALAVLRASSSSSSTTASASSPASAARFAPAPFRRGSHSAPNGDSHRRGAQPVGSLRRLRGLRASASSSSSSSSSASSGGPLYVDERGDASSDSVMADDLDSSRSRVTGEEIIHKTPWMQFKHLTYVDPTGKERAWDMVARSTRAPGARADAVCVFATLRKKGEEDTTLLVRQFRPPLNGEVRFRERSIVAPIPVQQPRSFARGMPFLKDRTFGSRAILDHEM